MSDLTKTQDETGRRRRVIGRVVELEGGLRGRAPARAAAGVVATIVLARMLGAVTFGVLSSVLLGGSLVGKVASRIGYGLIDVARFDLLTFWFGNGAEAPSVAGLALIIAFHVVAGLLVFGLGRLFREFERTADEPEVAA